MFSHGTMGLVAMKLLDLHAELVRLRWPIGVPVLHARAHCGTRDPNEGDAAEAVTRHLPSDDEAEAAAEALYVEAAAPRAAGRALDRQRRGGGRPH